MGCLSPLVRSNPTFAQREDVCSLLSALRRPYGTKQGQEGADSRGRFSPLVLHAPSGTVPQGFLKKGQREGASHSLVCSLRDSRGWEVAKPRSDPSPDCPGGSRQGFLLAPFKTPAERPEFLLAKHLIAPHLLAKREQQGWTLRLLPLGQPTTEGCCVLPSGFLKEQPKVRSDPCPF